MSLREQIQEDMKAAMRARDTERLGTIRMLLAAIKQREVDERREQTDVDVLAVVEKLIKQRKESARQFREGGRPELAEKEEAEIVFLQPYLPAALSDAEIDALIRAAVTESAAQGPRDMGKVLGILRPQVQGRVDMAVLSEKVKAQLST
ncbi:GatB/YqeY domain-containing protein [Acidithiobacillus sp. CV18-2]|uniref:GatB/YqeY domain-containing protein n=1 Tax=Igneacidithiobacillus copahuensis TaxID=2724909 RepID=A0AAE2YNG2_9PROT|nr:GatB/YqeY domain-containing protein [Igneacidithiobacillus copahuensis]MBU2754329.1 GatB/YqeY domain-containing protein [Acidithiobacillus sp. CV18-3]MBU2757648.1 GatB/YqeY domain-containing protein [Acidithiobacillus sp. BN09-2]MBU2777037.1 GatB/YqeY domain-containing protein [Acidithiobacillus sp. CV18-2]MBU2797349.1 GatB/YqeY domain-containing protein [Acidithiobacillus sp. VAN18-2]MBU2799812.1 GatB/YqeY domain-containing protein [Acidithiobacillus sp. VAN18-4]